MKKGFTLIELLAVIVILAIIALIAVPIVINIINDSKTSSDEQSVELYLDTVEKIITKKQLSNSNFNPDKCEIKDNGDLKCYKSNKLIDTIEIEVKGNVPNSGTILLTNNKIYYKNLLLNGFYYNKVAKLLLDNDNDGKISKGDKYSYKVNEMNVFIFYVLSFNEDDTVNLIMDRNICEDGTADYAKANNYCRVAWHAGESNNNYGPDTAMRTLYNATKDWYYVSNMIINFDDVNTSNSTTSGYSGIETNINTMQAILKGKNGASNTIIGTINQPLKARLPIENEINSNECRYNSWSGYVGSCPPWLVENLRYCEMLNGSYKYTYNMNNTKENYQRIDGYWLLNSANPSYTSYVTYVDFCGIYGYNPTNLSYHQNGIRPVITVPISDLED